MLMIVLGPDEEVVNISQRREKMPGQASHQILFPSGNVELQQTDLNNSYLAFTLGSKLIIPLCSLNSCLQLENRAN